jgi:hypothetical protein
MVLELFLNLGCIEAVHCKEFGDLIEKIIPLIIQEKEILNR